jgi:TM2 domain-containing membrane protein YozV
MKQKHGVPAIMSFFIPGLGQLIKGQPLKGLLFFLGVCVGLAFFIIPGVFIWLWSIIDAYNSNFGI